MWSDRILLPPFSNREDLTLLLSLFDDDLGQGINLSGTILANNGMPFTSSAWTVTDGAIVTTSATQITIPIFPIGNQLSALALTVGTGLGIVPGDQVVIADTATGKNIMIGTMVSYASATGALVAQIGMTYQCEIRRSAPKNTGSGYIPWYDFGTPDDLGPLVSATLGGAPNQGKILVVDMGVLNLNIPESVMRTLSSGTYELNMSIFDGVNTRQGIHARLPILYGGVTQ